jgi:hypothetical protein
MKRKNLPDGRLATNVREYKALPAIISPDSPSSNRQSLREKTNKSSHASTLKVTPSRVREKIVQRKVSEKSRLSSLQANLTTVPNPLHVCSKFHASEKDMELLAIFLGCSKQEAQFWYQTIHQAIVKLNRRSSPR